MIEFFASNFSLFSFIFNDVIAVIAVVYLAIAILGGIIWGILSVRKKNKGSILLFLSVMFNVVPYLVIKYIEPWKGQSAIPSILSIAIVLFLGYVVAFVLIIAFIKPLLEDSDEKSEQ